MADQGAVFREAVTDFQVVICTAVMPFDLNGETEATWKIAAWPQGFQSKKYHSQKPNQEAKGPKCVLELFQAVSYLHKARMNQAAKTLSHDKLGRKSQ